MGGWVGGREVGGWAGRIPLLESKNIQKSFHSVEIVIPLVEFEILKVLSCGLKH